jgi:hypothetical protein
MRKLLLTAVLGAALIVPALAGAKGPSGVSISGPGLDRSLSLQGDGEGPGTQLGTLTSLTGYFAQMFGQTPDPTRASRPSGKLGPRYTAVYAVPGPNAVASRVVQYIYPYAKRPVTYMKRGQKFWDGKKTHGGWYSASARLKTILVQAGLPSTAP